MTIEEKRAVMDRHLRILDEQEANDLGLATQYGGEKFSAVLDIVVAAATACASDGTNMEPLRAAFRNDTLLQIVGPMAMSRMSRCLVEVLRKEIEDELNAAPKPRI